MAMTADQEFVLEFAKLTGIFGSIICICAAAVAGMAFYRQGTATTFINLIKQTGILQIITVILIISGIVNLQVLNKISPEATIAMLSGIVGYVLGGLRPRRDATTRID